jgi:hypothetical protein
MTNPEDRSGGQSPPPSWDAPATGQGRPSVWDQPPGAGQGWGPPAGQGQPPAGYGPPGYGQPPAGYAPHGYGPYGYGPPPTPGTNGMAIASLVLGIIWIYWLGSVLALVFGYIARKQIRERGEAGSGLATAGIVLGWIGVATLVLVVGFFVVGASTGGFESQFETY